jgi:DNA replication initiation complex subunit (GINS family)
MKQRLKRPTDPIQLAKLVADNATGQVEDEPPTQDDVRRVMSMLGKIGGPIGGAARAAKLSATKRKLIAKHAALARWKKEVTK